MNEQPWKIAIAEEIFGDISGQADTATEYTAHWAEHLALTVIDLADPSVGLGQAEWHVSCPFNLGEVDNDELEAFRQAAIEFYAPFADGKIIAFYSTEKMPF